jgi:hypothetical protein
MFTSMSAKKASSFLNSDEIIRLAREGKTEQVLIELRRAVEEDPDNIQALLWLGGLTPNIREGMAALKRVLQIQPVNEAAARGLRQLRQRQLARTREDSAPSAVGSPPTDESSPASIETGSTEEPQWPVGSDPLQHQPEYQQQNVTSLQSQASLHVVRCNGFLDQPVEQGWGLRLALAWTGIALALGSLAGGLALLCVIGFGGGQVSGWWGLVALAAVTGAAIALPRFEGLAREYRNAKAARQGEERLMQLLAEEMDGRWTLFHHVGLPEGWSDIDAVLVGPNGVYVLEVRAYAGRCRNIGKQWQRNYWGRWVTLDRNPTKGIWRKAEWLEKYLAERGITVEVAPRVVWAGAGQLWAENPAVRIWSLRALRHAWKDIRTGEWMHAELVERVVSVLEEMCGG